MLTPGGTHTFDLNLVSGGASGGSPFAPQPLDVIEIQHVQWADGSEDGVSPYNFGSTIESDGGRRLQLSRVIGILQRGAEAPDEVSGTTLLERIRTSIERLPNFEKTQLPAAQTSMRLTKDAALADLTRFQQDPSSSHSRSAVAQWLRHTIERYDGWTGRLAQ